mgnify:CR=1 FL=1
MDIIHEPTAQDVILADTQRRLQAGLAALCQVGPEPEPNTCAWLDWLSRMHAAAEEAFRRLN